MIKRYIIPLFLMLMAVGYSAQLTVNVGTTANDGTGDNLRTAFGKVNTNFSALFTNSTTFILHGATNTDYTNALVLTAGSGITLSTNGSQLTITSSGGGGGGTTTYLTNVVTVSTIAQMVALGTTNLAAIVNDPKRGGVFVLTNSASGTNFGTLIGSATAGYSWKRIFTGPYRTEWFGTADDDSTSDTAALQNALDSLPNGETLEFGPGTKLTGNLRIDGKVNNRFVGRGAILHLTGSPPTGLGVGLQITNSVTNLVFEALYVKGDGTTNNRHAGWWNASGATLHNVKWLNNVVTDTRLGIGANADSSGVLNGIEISGNFFTNIVGEASGDGYGINVTYGQSTPNGSPSYTIIRGNRIDMAQRHDIYVAKGQSVIVDGNISTRHRNIAATVAQRPAISINRGCDITVVNNLILNPYDGGIDVGSDAGYSPDRIIIAGNQVYNVQNAVPALTIGVLAPGTDGTPSNIQVYGNKLTGTAAVELLRIYSGKQVLVHHNELNHTGATSAVKMLSVLCNDETAGTANYSDNIRVENNRFYGTVGGGGSLYGIQIGTPACTSAARLVFRDNGFMLPAGSSAEFFSNTTITDPNIHCVGQAITGLSLSTTNGLVGIAFPAVTNLISVHKVNNETSGYQIYNTYPGGYGSALRIFSRRTDDNQDYEAARIQAVGAAAWGGAASASTHLDLQTINAGTLATRWRLQNNGHLVPGADASYDIGTTSTRARSGYFSGTVRLGGVGTSKLVRTDSNGDSAAVTIGSGITFDGTTLSASGGGSQTPWASVIDGGGYAATNVGALRVTGSITNDALTASAVVVTDSNKALSSVANKGQGSLLRYDGTNYVFQSFTNSYHWLEEFCDTASAGETRVTFTASGGTGAACASSALSGTSDNYHPGQAIITIGTGTSGTGGGLFKGTTTIKPFATGAGRMKVEFMVLASALWDGSNDGAWRVGLWDTSTSSSTNFSNSIEFRYNKVGSTTDGKWRGYCRKSGAETADSAAASATVSATTWYHLAFVVAGDGGQVDFYVNGTLIGSVTGTGNIPSATMILGVQGFAHGALASTRSLYVDYIDFDVAFYNRRF